MQERKDDHITLAVNSQTSTAQMDKRFYYEPMLSAHPDNESLEITFLNKKFRIPLWVSSMTGGSKLAGFINSNLARACKEFGMGMGLGSCRALLDSNEYLSDFKLRPIIGWEQALYANLGISQIEQSIQNNKVYKIVELVKRLEADGLIIHVNPMQEWFQPEGDRLKYSPIETIEKFLHQFDFNVIVKEVGQGIGPDSLRKLLKLPITAIEFSAFGGTNFTTVELKRSTNEILHLYEPFSRIGVDAETMTQLVNDIVTVEKEISCRQIIISGGIKNFLDGYYLISKSKLPAIYGQASTMLEYAKESYESLHRFIDSQVKGISLAKAYLKVKQ